MKINNICRTLYAGKHTWGFECWGRWASAAALCVFLFSPASLRAQTTTVNLSPCTNCKNDPCSAFYASATTYYGPNAWLTVTGLAEKYDELNEYNPATGLFTASKDGIYIFYAESTLTVGADNSRAYTQIIGPNGQASIDHSELYGRTTSAIFKMQAGESAYHRTYETAPNYVRTYIFSGARVDCAASGGDSTAGTGVGAGTTAERPTTPSLGTVRLNTDTSKFEGWDGSAWVDLN